MSSNSPIADSTGIAGQRDQVEKVEHQQHGAQNSGGPPVVPPRRGTGMGDDQMKPLRDNLKASYDEFQQRVSMTKIRNQPPLLVDVNWINQVQRAISIAPKRRAALLDYEAAWAEFQEPVQKLNELKQDLSEEYSEARDMVAPNSNQAAEGAVKGSTKDLDLRKCVFFYVATSTTALN